MQKRRIIIFALVVVMLLTSAVSAFGAETSLDMLTQETAGFLTTQVSEPMFGSVGGEWLVFGLSRSGANAPEGYYQKYESALLSEIEEKGGVLSTNKYSEYARVIIASESLGLNPCNLGGYDFTQKLLETDKVRKQGIVGISYALIALNSGNYQKDFDRSVYIDALFDREIVIADDKSGFSLDGRIADPDVTAMVLEALTPYREREDFSALIERCLNYLSSVQCADGTFESGGLKTSESVSQVITALSGLGISPFTDERFIKTDAEGEAHNLLDALLLFRTEDGGYKHLLDGEADLMASEQALYALAAANRLEKGEAPLFHLNENVPYERTRYEKALHTCVLRKFVD